MNRKPFGHALSSADDSKDIKSGARPDGLLACDSSKTLLFVVGVFVFGHHLDDDESS